MQALIVIESWFGNTHTIGAQIADELERGGVATTLYSVADAPTVIPESVGLVVIGAPTHNRGLSTPVTRSKAAAMANNTNAPETGVREWIPTLSISVGTQVAIFDTVTGKTWLSGSAAKVAAKLIGKSHPDAPVSIQSFVVKGTQGPLAPGETSAAHAWGEALSQS